MTQLMNYIKSSTLISLMSLCDISHKDISEIRVDDLIKALEVTPQEVALIQEMTTGQKEKPLCMNGCKTVESI